MMIWTTTISRRGEKKSLKECAAQLAPCSEHWKTSCVIPVANSLYRLVIFKSHIIKTLLVRLEATDAMEAVQFAYEGQLGVKDAVLYILHGLNKYLEHSRCCVRRVIFLLFICIQY